jgi:CheY-like chemotaxis protein
MPNADGIETTRAVKRVAPELPVIGLTGAHIHGTEVCLRAMIAFGAVAALSKPLNVPAFLSTVRRVIDNPGRNPAITSSAGAVL